MSNCSTGSFVGKWNIEGLPQGTDQEIRITWKPEGTVIDLSTYTAKLQVRKSYGLPVIIELSTTAGDITLGASVPNIVLTFPKEKTESLTGFENMIYDLEVTSSSGNVTRVIEGTFSISRQVTV